MKITKDMTVEEVIKYDEKLMPKLMEYGIDCCCGAYKSLKASADELGLDPDEVVNALQQFESVK